jgi:uncharacterized RDD family membrane protein YckC
MNCPNCETYNQAGANYCANCGRQLAAPENAQHEDGRTVEGDTQPAPEAGPGLLLQTSTDLAGIPIRAAAYAIDLLLVNINGLFIAAFLGSTGFLTYVVYAASIGYMVLFTGLRGQTPGKMILGLHVVRPGRPVPGIGPALVRELLGRPLSLLSLGLGYAWAGWDPWKQTWHDKLAGTYVVRSRTGLFTPPPE